MQNALRGTWILKEYEDSIDAGLTPRLLELNLIKRSVLTYINGKMISNGFEKWSNEKVYPVGNSEESYLLCFYPSQNKFSIEISSAKMGSKLDTAEFIIDGLDTVLRVFDKSNSHVYIKYDIDKCPDISPYTHLVNSKFIAGKYYNATDTAKRHHIIFTKCGNVEGAELIDSYLKDYKDYQIEIDDFNCTPDCISFIKPNLKDTTFHGKSFLWKVNSDSLILYNHNGNELDNSIILLRAR